MALSTCQVLHNSSAKFLETHKEFVTFSLVAFFLGPIELINYLIIKVHLCYAVIVYSQYKRLYTYIEAHRWTEKRRSRSTMFREKGKEMRNLPTPLVTDTAIDGLQPRNYLPECRSLCWALIPALLNQPKPEIQD